MISYAEHSAKPPYTFRITSQEKVKVTFTGASNNPSNRDYIIGSFKQGHGNNTRIAERQKAITLYIKMAQ
ncbi:MAG: hypothetical protein L6V35_08955 [Alistipes putredinis]|nr:MAG: hypothetical protein L6V35_08955 [Alistipes putredinis]